MAEKAILEHILKSGGAVVLPTETVYGLFARALDETAVRQVYQLKQRPLTKAMNLNVADYEAICQYSSQQPVFLKKLYDSFLPGPLTIILKANDKVPAWVNAGLETVGFRVPDYSLTQDLIKSCGPLIGPSANLSGLASGKVYDEIMQQFQGQLEGWSDDSAIQGLDSTILDLSGGTACILRQGAITQEDLLAAVPEMTF